MGPWDCFENSRNLQGGMKRSSSIQGGISQLPVFLAVAEKLSFSRAAASLGISPSAVSQAITRLERELGSSLVVRTTRSVNLTDAGRRLAHSARPALAAAEAALETARTPSNELVGTLRLNVPRLVCRGLLPAVLAEFARRHPGVHVAVIAEDRNVDIVARGFDAGIRLREAVEKDMVAVRLTERARFVVVGSKRYLARHGRPNEPRDLLDHTCLAWRSPTTGEQWRWEFEAKGRPLDVGVSGPISSNDVDLLLSAARAGLGLAMVAEEEAHPDVRSGRLEVVLDAFSPHHPGLFLYYPRATQQDPKLAAFVACARSVTRGSAASQHKDRRA